MITDAEAERLLAPTAIGMRTFIEIGRAQAALDGEDDAPAHAGLTQEFRGVSRDEQQDMLALIQALDRIVSALIIEHGGRLPS